MELELVKNEDDTDIFIGGWFLGAISDEGISSQARKQLPKYGVTELYKLVEPSDPNQTELFEEESCQAEPQSN